MRWFINSRYYSLRAILSPFLISNPKICTTSIFPNNWHVASLDQCDPSPTETSVEKVNGKRNRGKRKRIFEARLPEFCALSAGRRTPNTYSLIRWKSNNRSARLTFTFFPEKLALFSHFCHLETKFKTVVSQLSLFDPDMLRFHHFQGQWNR